MVGTHKVALRRIRHQQLVDPGFFFEVKVEGGIERNEVVDGQQRLTTLFDYFNDDFSLVDSQDAPYLSPNSVHYAGKRFKELPQAYQQAFKKYRLTVIKLRNLEDMRLEVFRRINQGGTPLSGQDIRLAYYGEKSKSLALIRLVGIYDNERQSAKRFIDSAKIQFGIKYPWTSKLALDAWRDWWEDKEIARGQTASEMFLRTLVCAQADKLDAILTNKAALQKLNARFDRAIDEVLDVYAAQLRWQDTDSSTPLAWMAFNAMHDEFFPYFQTWIESLLGEKGPSLPVTKHRIMASLIGAAYKENVDPKKFSEQQWTNVTEFVRRPQDVGKKLNEEWPLSKGRWDGSKGYKAQMAAACKIIRKIADVG